MIDGNNKLTSHLKHTTNQFKSCVEDPLRKIWNYSLTTNYNWL